MGQDVALGGEKTHGTHIRLIECLVGNALQHLAVAGMQRWCGQWRELLDDHLPALQQLSLQAG